MKKLAQMLACGEITIEDLADASGLIEQANLIDEGIKACKKGIFLFPWGKDTIQVYDFYGSGGESHHWATFDRSGELVFYSNWGGDHQTGRCNLNDIQSVYECFEKHETEGDISRFLMDCI